MAYRARITKCTKTNVSLDDSTWNCDKVPAIVSNVYKSEKCLLGKVVPKLGRFKVELYYNPYELSHGIRETIIIWNGKIVSRRNVNEQ